MSEHSPTATLKPWPRLILLSVAWLLLVTGGPGVLSGAGYWPLALIGVTLWGVVNLCSGPKSFWIDVLVSGLGWAYVVQWSGMVFWFCLVWMGVGFGLWQASAGAFLRRCRHLPASLALPAVWVGLETLRTVSPLPFGLSWMRLGTHLHDSFWISESVRFWGVGGLSWVLASCAGWLVDCTRLRLSAKTTEGAEAAEPGLSLSKTAFLRSSLVLAAVLVFACSVRLWLPAPATTAGPSVLIVQPNIPQERKQQGGDRMELFRNSLELTDAGLRRAAEGGEDVDLVLWGETMWMVSPIQEPDLLEAWRSGKRAAPWWGVGEADLIGWGKREDEAVTVLMGDGRRTGLLPAGTGFMTGAELWRSFDEGLGRQNGVALYASGGELVGLTAKRKLVPGAENFLGLERFGWARDIIYDIAGYVPDHRAGEGPQVLLFSNERGAWKLGVSVCFDNAYDEPYTQTMREDPVDFFVVCSNEGWFKDSLELDQMIAFSRLIAMSTGRSMVRATNTGISCVIGPDGRLVAELTEGTEELDRKEIAGTLLARVPAVVSSSPGEGQALPSGLQATPFVRLELLWTLLWILSCPLALLIARRRKS